MTYTAETLCLLEVWFPPGFFDVMPHLMIHLVGEVGMLGPVHSRWCYGVERFLYVLKKSVRNRCRPKACMANGFLSSKALNYITDYNHLSHDLKRRMWDTKDDQRLYGEKLEGTRRKITLFQREIDAIHDYVIDTIDLQWEFEAEHNSLPKRRGNEARPVRVVAEYVQSTIQERLDRGEYVDPNLAVMSKPPSASAHLYY